jgi:uncharacterized protein (TIGR03084 family)
MPELLADLTAEADELDRLVSGLDPDDWQRPTPAPGWTIAHQVAHLAADFRLAATAAADPDGFTALLGRLAEQVGDDFDASVRAAMAGFLAQDPASLLASWRAERADAVRALAAVPPGRLLPWLVSPLPAAVLAQAGLMEVFAHGQDIYDALGARREPTDRLRHLVEFGVRNRDFGYHVRGLTPPAGEFRFSLTAPSGASWEFGPADEPRRIAGPAVDFCLLVTRRRHPDDLALVAADPVTEEWLHVAQAYRGPAGTGRTPGQFSAVGRSPA